MVPISDSTDRSLQDKAWRGYDPRAAVPVIALAAIASAALLYSRWYLDDRSDAWIVYPLALAVWPGLLTAALYRAVTYTYRVTDRAVLVDWGFVFRPEPPAWLADVAAVKSGANWVGRRLGFGWVSIATGAGREVRMNGVRDPTAFAALIRAAITAVKTAQPGSASAR